MPENAGWFDYFTLSQGDKDPILKRNIEILILKTHEYVVYLDEEISVQWSGNNLPSGGEFGEILNRVSLLESSSSFITDRKILAQVRGQIGEGLARCMEGNATQARLILDAADKMIIARNTEVSWDWYFNCAYYQGCASTCVIVAIWIGRDIIVRHTGLTAFHVFLCALVGAVGSVLSTASRSNRIQLDANAGKNLHISEATARIVVGFFGGAFVCLLLKAGLFFEAFKPKNSLALLLSVAFVAGAGERLIPNTIKRVEEQVK